MDQSVDDCRIKGTLGPSLAPLDLWKVIGAVSESAPVDTCAIFNDFFMEND